MDSLPHQILLDINMKHKDKLINIQWPLLFQMYSLF